eukprot:scaffold43515_cov45-Phaeocystis_antarctica.AAC.1
MISKKKLIPRVHSSVVQVFTSGQRTRPRGAYMFCSGRAPIADSGLAEGRLHFYLGDGTWCGWRGDGWWILAQSHELFQRAPHPPPPRPSGP